MTEQFAIKNAQKDATLMGVDIHQARNPENFHDSIWITLNFSDETHFRFRFDRGEKRETIAKNLENWIEHLFRAEKIAEED